MFNGIQKQVQEFVSENATTLLTAGAVVGTVATGVLAGRTGYKYAQLIDEAERERLAPIPEEERGDIERENAKLTKLEKAQVAGIHFIPPVMTGGVTIGMIILSHRMSAQKAAALAAAYGISRQQLEEYREKVATKLTGPKKEAVDAELAQERVNRAPGSGSNIIVTGDEVLCFDEATGRYFKSSMEKINSAVNRTKEECWNGEYASANFFYQELGLPDTTWGEEVGFNRDHLPEVIINVVLDKDTETTPVLSMNFQRMPTENYIRRVFD